MQERIFLISRKPPAGSVPIDGQHVIDLSNICVNTKMVSTPLNDAPALPLDFAYLYHLLLSKCWLIILVTVLSLVAAIAYLIWAPKIYESRAVIEVDQETPRVTSANIQDINAEDVKAPEVLKTIAQALLSETLLLRVLEANGLDKNPLFAPPKPDGSASKYTELAARFKSKVNALVRRGTRLI